MLKLQLIEYSIIFSEICLRENDDCNPGANGMAGSPKCCEPWHCKNIDTSVNKCVLYEPR